MSAATPPHPRLLVAFALVIAAAVGVIAWVGSSPPAAWRPDGGDQRDRPVDPGSRYGPGGAGAQETGFSPATAPESPSEQPGPARSVASTGRNLQVRVIDALQHPLPHHEIALFDDYWYGGCSSGVEYWRGVTDATGVATIEDIDAILNRHALRIQSDNGSMSFKLDIHGIAHGEIRLTTAAMRQAQVTLTAPLTETMHVRVLDPGGVPVAGANVYINAAQYAGHDPDQTIAAARTDDEGRVSLDRIEIGAWIQVGAWLDDRRWCRVMSPVAPWVSRSTAPIVLAFERAPVRVRGRLVDPLGRPFVTKRFQIERETRGAKDAWGDDILNVGRGPVRYETDDDGRFDLAFSGAIAAGQHELRVIDQGDLLVHGSQTFFVPNLAETGAIEVGNIVVEPAPVLFTGRVVDGAGKPVSSAKLSVELVGAESAYLYRTTGPDEQGSFSVRGICHRLNARIEATCKGFLSSGTTAVDGPGPWVLQLTRAGSIQISTRIELEDAFPNLDVFVDDEWTAYVYEDEPELLDGIPPGTHHIALQAAGEPVVAFDVQVRPGEVTVVPTIDLRGQLHEVSVVVQGADGEPLDNGWFIRTDIADPEVEYFSESIHLLPPRRTANLEISAYGHGVVAVVAGPVEQIVRLPPPIEVQVIPFAGPGSLVPPPRSLVAGDNQGPLVEEWLKERGAVDFKQGSYLFKVPRPGRYQIAPTAHLPAIPIHVEVVGGRQVIQLGSSVVHPADLEDRSG